MSVAWSPDGTRLAYDGLFDLTVITGPGIGIWDAETGDPIRTLAEHTDGVRSVAWSPDGMRIASGSGDSTVQIWNADTGDPIRTLEGHTTDWVSSVAVYSPDGIPDRQSAALDGTIQYSGTLRRATRYERSKGIRIWVDIRGVVSERYAACQR